MYPAENLGKLLFTLALTCLWSCSVTANNAANSGTVKASAANLTAYNTPYAQYVDYERDPRQWFTSNYGTYGAAFTPFTGGVEAIIIGFLIAIGIGFIGLPLMILLYSMFLGNTGSGFNFIAPGPTTTTINGRKRRDILQSMFPTIDPKLQEKLLRVFKQFMQAPDKMEHLMKFLRS